MKYVGCVHLYIPSKFGERGSTPRGATGPSFSFYSHPFRRMPVRKAVMDCLCFLLFLFLLNALSLKRPKVLWRQIWQNEGPRWEGVVRKFHGYPSRGFSRGSEKLSKKYAFSDLENFFSFTQKRFIMGTLRSKVPLIITVAP